MKKNLAVISIGIATLLGTAACGSSDSTEPEGTSQSVVPVESETQAPEETKSERGNTVLELGESASVDSVFTNEKALEFTVEDIAPVKCTEEFAQPAENGQMYAVDIAVAVENVPELNDVSITGYSWTFISTEGTTFNGDLASVATYGCLSESETLPITLGPGEKATGKILVDLPAEEGTLVFEPNVGQAFEYELK